jgi:hypothetical protein
MSDVSPMGKPVSSKNLDPSARPSTIVDTLLANAEARRKEQDAAHQSQAERERRLAEHAKLRARLRRAFDEAHAFPGEEQVQGRKPSPEWFQRWAARFMVVGTTLRECDAAIGNLDLVKRLRTIASQAAPPALAYACAILVLASEGEAEDVASALAKAQGDSELRGFVLWLPFIVDRLWHPFPDADGLTRVAEAPEGTSHEENVQAGEAFGWKPLVLPRANRTTPTVLGESETILDFGHLKRLQPEEQHVYDRLESAFQRLGDSMRREHFFGPDFDRNVQGLAQCVGEVEGALTAAGAKKAPAEWQVTTESEGEARQLLTMGQAATANGVAVLFGRLTVHDPVRWQHVQQHVARFGEAVLAALRPAQPSPTTLPGESPVSPTRQSLPTPKVGYEPDGSFSDFSASAQHELEEWQRRRASALRAIRAYCDAADTTPPWARNAETLVWDLDRRWSREWCRAVSLVAAPPKVEDMRLWCDLQYTALGLAEHAKLRRSWVRCETRPPDEVDDSSSWPGRPVVLEDAVGPLLCLLDDQQPADWTTLVQEIGLLHGARCEDDEVLSQEALGRMIARAWVAMRDIGAPVPPEEINITTIPAARRALDLVKNWLHHREENPVEQWEFALDAFRYKNADWHKLKKQPLRLLQAFVYARRMTLTNEEVNQAATGDLETLSDRPCAYVSELNKELCRIWKVQAKPIRSIPGASAHRLQLPF